MKNEFLTNHFKTTSWEQESMAGLDSGQVPYVTYALMWVEFAVDSCLAPGKNRKQIPTLHIPVRST